jgi:two-component system, NtrC family, response regulator AtoC
MLAEPSLESNVRIDHGAIMVDPAMTATYQLIHRLSRSPLAVLITGETGTGKEKAAQTLHHASPRAGGAFVAVNCSAIPDALVESELFGHERGAFSGAERTKPGLIERASGGTLFLDEICELPAPAQAKLLRALETRSVLRVGGAAPIDVDFRIVAATHRDVAAELAAGRFRADLYYRIAAAVIHLPPLRERPLDIPVLARSFLGRACARLGRPPLALAPDALRALAAYAFPGNVRELLNAMDYAAATCTDTIVERCALPSPIAIAKRVDPTPPAITARGLPRLDDEIEQLERRRIAEALAVTAGNQGRAARLIGMPRRTFVSKLRRYRLGPCDTGRQHFGD